MDKPEFNFPFVFTPQRVEAIEYGVYSYPEGLEGWRCYRLEYGGHAESCIKECVLWLPPKFDMVVLEDLIREAQKC